MFPLFLHTIYREDVCQLSFYVVRSLRFVLCSYSIYFVSFFFFPIYSQFQVSLLLTSTVFLVMFFYECNAFFSSVELLLFVFPPPKIHDNCIVIVFLFFLSVGINLFFVYLMSPAPCLITATTLELITFTTSEFSFVFRIFFILSKCYFLTFSFISSS